MAALSPSLRQQVLVCIGDTGMPVGTLVYARHGRRENASFAYHDGWLEQAGGFNVSADLHWGLGHQPHKAASPQDSVFHGALADTAPDAWGRRVIARDHAKRRKEDPALPPPSEQNLPLAVALPKVEDLKELRMGLAEKVERWAKEHELRGEQRGRAEGLQAGRQKGREEGRAEGLAEGLAAGQDKARTLILQRLLAQRFGELPPYALEKIQHASPAQIDVWIDRVLDAPTLDAVFDA